MKRGRTGGFSVIDAILSIVIVAASFLALGSVVSSTSMQNLDVDLSTTAVFLARGKMAEVMARDFDSIASAATANFGGSYSPYSFTIGVDYVDGVNLDTPVPGPTSYKRVEVSVEHGGWAGNIHLYDLKVKIP